MRFTHIATALAAVACVAVTAPAQAKTFKWSFQGDAQSLDPYVLNETFTLGFLGNIYEGLVRRDPDLKIIPALAESWEIPEPTRWRFHLRKGVKFQNGNDFTADDVVFSADRVRADGSDLKTRVGKDVKVVKVDDHTVDFITPAPNPILHSEWSTWYIIDKEWAEANDAVAPSSVTEGKTNYAAFNANGTGAFKVKERQADVKTVFVPNETWWNAANKKHNLTEVTFTPISSDATRVAALLSGEIDLMYPVPVQDMARIDSNNGTSVLAGPELRTIFLGMDQRRDELLHSSVKGKNPFKDKRVRQAFYQAIDIEAIKTKIMRGLSTPSALMVAPGINGSSPNFERLPYDPDNAKKLLTEAGYPDGFTVTLDCPNNRYVNDEAICQAVVSMLAKVGVKIDLLAQPKANYFKKILAPALDTSFYLLGWTPGSFDSWNVLYNILGCYDDATGSGKFNLGGYCSPEADKLTAMVKEETDQAKRQALIEQVWKINVDDVSYIPLHQQGLAWGKKDNIDLVQRADNEFMMYHVNVK
ncbi:ABC transporter substrate-binding protein [Alphaproteobacteria bacterium HT1-32]|nr:ABC transporter substrate-binding protein [Alphaproteobacteria bacterium HT1-32]